MGALAPLSLEILRPKRRETYAHLRSDRAAAANAAVRRTRYTLPLDPAATARAQCEVELLRRVVKQDLRHLAADLDSDLAARRRAAKLRRQPDPDRLERITEVGGQQWP